MDNINVTIAGPGAGKTYSMVEAVLKYLPKLSPSRYMCVITYTNAATQEIKNRLEHRITLPKNVFIGTIHSFLYKFIIKPFANIVDAQTPDPHLIDEAFTPKPWFIGQHPDYMDYAQSLLEEGFDQYQIWQMLKKKWREDKSDELEKKGMVVFDKVLGQAYDNIQHPGLGAIVANKLQCVFVDEYQDARLVQHRTLMEIHQYGKSELFFIGDPLQSIYNFTYELSHLRDEVRPLNFEEIPLKQLISLKKNSVVRKLKNYRSDNKIVRFVNIFQINEFRQEEIGEEGNSVFFINKQSLSEIINFFYQKVEELGISDESHEKSNIMHSLILTRNNDLNDEVNQIVPHQHISNSILLEQPLSELYNYILGVLEVSRFELVNDYGISRIHQRKTVIDTYHYIENLIKQKDESINELLKPYGSDNLLQKKIYDFWNVQLSLFLDNKEFVEQSNTDKVKRIFFETREKLSPALNRYVGTIHKTKGLEATCVLVIGGKKHERAERTDIENWLDVEKTGDSDESRLGYVAFSRARKLLCFASLEPINEKLSKHILSLGVKTL